MVLPEPDRTQSLSHHGASLATRAHLAPLRPRSTALVGSDSLPFAALAKREGVSPSYFTRLVRLSYLAPEIAQAILDGRQPRDLTADVSAAVILTQVAD